MGRRKAVGVGPLAGDRVTKGNTISGRKVVEGMKIEEIEEIAKLLPTFVKMCENDLGEAEHDVPVPLTSEQSEQVARLADKLRNCCLYVDQNIFE